MINSTILSTQLLLHLYCVVEGKMMEAYYFLQISPPTTIMPYNRNSVMKFRRGQIEKDVSFLIFEDLGHFSTIQCLEDQ